MALRPLLGPGNADADRKPLVMSFVEQGVGDLD